METQHRFYLEDARDMSDVADEQIDLVLTSPPYPMIEMWDATFEQASPDIGKALSKSDGNGAFELMHNYLDDVWRETYRVLKPGGMACINIGDAVRTLNGHFQLFPNHVRIVSICRDIGFSLLPSIIWRKPTNAPNKFMGSGMLPPGAYVTLEHEHILLFRKQDKREFTDDASKQNRRDSAYFWEERNQWFSDIWFDLRGADQSVKTDASRSRSGAFPLDLPYRLIVMFSVMGDTVLDPFLGTGTTMVSAMCAARNSIGYERDASMQPIILKQIASAPAYSHDIVDNRLVSHQSFMEERLKSKGDPKYTNSHYGFPVITRQEQELVIAGIRNIQYLSGDRFKVAHTSSSRSGQQDAGKTVPADDKSSPIPKAARGRQLKLF